MAWIRLLHEIYTKNKNFESIEVLDRKLELNLEFSSARLSARGPKMGRIPGRMVGSERTLSFDREAGALNFSRVSRSRLCFATSGAGFGESSRLRDRES